MYDVIIVGGGAAGFYAAIHVAELSPGLKIAILERGKNVLSKVRISGGGRCNVTHGEFSPQELALNYPRGQRELLGPFHKHGPGDVMDFFEKRGVPLKIEGDGRVFPVSDNSQSIIDCLVGEAERLGVKVLKNSGVNQLTRLADDDLWQVTTMNKHYTAKKILLTPGSSPKIWKLLEQLGHSIVNPVPSLFSFNIKDTRLEGVQGLSAFVHVEIPAKKVFSQKVALDLKSVAREEPVLHSEGMALITHWGLSGPAILKLSAWGAKILNKYQYNFKIRVNWMPEYTTGSMERLLREIKEVESKKTVIRTRAMEIPKRLWIKLVHAAGIENDVRWAEVTKEMLQNLAVQLTACTFRVMGKSTFKEEFVTAGGIDLREINFKDFESKIHPNLYFAGEVINVDAITGGFNFQNAWTGAYIAAQAIAAED
nr:NAD(P)/FAD-dependent oxidoreductase [Allomuricauda sp.]